MKEANVYRLYIIRFQLYDHAVKGKTMEKTKDQCLPKSGRGKIIAENKGCVR